MLFTLESSYLMFSFLLTDDDVTLEWTLRHGRSAALFVALKEAPSTIYVNDYKEKIHKSLLGYLATDRVSHSSSSYFEHLITSIL